MFVNNPISNDPRVKREAAHLVQAGHEVTVIGRAVPELPRREIWEGVHFWRIPIPGYKLVGFAKKVVNRISGDRSLNTKEKVKRQRLKISEMSLIKANKSRRLNPLNLLRVWISNLQISLSWVTSGLHLRADVYHAHDLDTLLYAYLCAKKKTRLR